MEDGWDLHAVVKSCVTTSSNVDTSIEMDRNEDKLETNRNESDELVSNSKFGETNINMCGGDDQWLAATAGATTSTITRGTSISFGGGTFSDDERDSISFSFGPDDSTQPVQDSKRKKKKKRVVELREEELSSDGWAWRKYGQKPIKGSSHPRNYYRCSTRKECSARKQVERSPTDTNNYIVSYTGSHLHPQPTHLSSLAGTTRITTKSATTSLTDQQLPRLSSSSPHSTSSFSPTDDSFKEDDTEMNDNEIDELIKNY